MRGAHKEISPETLHGNGFVSQALASVHQNLGTHRMGEGCNLFNRVAAAKSVADVDQAHQARFLRELIAQVGEVKGAVRGHTHMPEYATGALSEQLPRHQVAVVLHHGEQHLVTSLQLGITPTARHQIDGFRCIAGEHNLL